MKNTCRFSFHSQMLKKIAVCRFSTGYDVVISSNTLLFAVLIVILYKICMQEIYTTQHKRARGGQTNKQTPKNCRGHRKMIRQKHAKRKSQTECEIHGQIH